MKRVLHLFIIMLSIATTLRATPDVEQDTIQAAPNGEQKATQTAPEMNHRIQRILAHVDGLQNLPARATHDLVLCINQLSDDERTSLVKALQYDFAPPLTRGSTLPSSLAQALNKHDEQQEHCKPKFDMPRRKFTTLTIAPNVTTSCFLPRVFSFSRHGKYFMFLALGIGATLGILTTAALERYLRVERPAGNIDRRTKADINYENKCADVKLISTGSGIGAGLLLTLSVYFGLKGSYKKDEDILIAEFIEKEWPRLRETMIWPQHVVSILDYLYHKMEQGTFDLQEAKQCIGALHEPGKVT